MELCTLLRKSVESLNSAERSQRLLRDLCADKLGIPDAHRVDPDLVHFTEGLLRLV